MTEGSRPHLHDIETVRFVARVGRLVRDLSIDLPEGGTLRVSRVEFDYECEDHAGDPWVNRLAIHLRREGLSETGGLVVATPA